MNREQDCHHCRPLRRCLLHDRELANRGVEVYGLSTQTTEYQREMAERLHLPFEVLSDARFALIDALRLPTFEVEGMRLIKRLTLIVQGPADRARVLPRVPAERERRPGDRLARAPPDLTRRPTTAPGLAFAAGCTRRLNPSQNLTY